MQATCPKWAPNVRWGMQDASGSPGAQVPTSLPLGVQLTPGALAYSLAQFHALSRAKVKSSHKSPMRRPELGDAGHRTNLGSWRLPLREPKGGHGGRQVNNSQKAACESLVQIPP